MPNFVPQGNPFNTIANFPATVEANDQQVAMDPILLQQQSQQNQARQNQLNVQPQQLQQQTQMGAAELVQKQLQNKLDQHNYATQLLGALSPDGSNYSDIIAQGKQLGLGLDDAPAQWGPQAQQYVDNAKQTLYSPQTQLALANMQREWANTQSEIAHRSAIEDIARQRLGGGMGDVSGGQGAPQTGGQSSPTTGGQTPPPMPGAPGMDGGMTPPAQIPTAPSTDQQTGTPGFGFNQQHIPPAVMNQMAKEDSARNTAAQKNVPIAKNMLDDLDDIENNLSGFTTGGVAPQTRYATDKALALPSGTAANDIDKASNDLALNSSKFLPQPGQRGSVLQLQTILASKPGIEQDPTTNQNIINDQRAKINDYLLSSDLQQKYREASPNKIADQQVYDLDNALKTLYPLQSKTVNGDGVGIIQFNKQNVAQIQSVMKDAVANPAKYMQAAQAMQASPGGRVNIITPNGQPANIDSAHLGDLIKDGGKVAQ